MDRSDKADAARMRWMLSGNGYFMEEQYLCGHGPCPDEEQDRARKSIDHAMKYDREHADPVDKADAERMQRRDAAMDMSGMSSAMRNALIAMRDSGRVTMPWLASVGRQRILRARNIGKARIKELDAIFDQSDLNAEYWGG